VRATAFPIVTDRTHLKENANMNKLSYLSALSAAFLAFTTFAPAQQQIQVQDLGEQDPLVQAVRNATQKYQNAAPKGYSPALGCVSGPDHGAMGIHYVNGLFNGETLLSNGQLDPAKPQALIYEPQSNGEMKLVGVEFIIFASALPAGAAPEVQGHLMQYIEGPSTARPDASPNRYGLPGFFELHVWAWRENPQGPFVDWNNHVSCALQ
jgi:hypothetical protein